MAVLCLDALSAAIGDLAIGLLIGVAAFVLIVGPLVYMEARYGAESDDEQEPDQSEDIWSFPPKWSAPRAESDLGSERRAA